MPPSSATPPPPGQAKESNRRLLGILLFFELVLGTAWTILLITPAQSNSGYGTITCFLIVYPLQLLCMIGGGVSLWKHRINLNFAILVLITPLIFAVIPFLINVLSGNPPALQSPGLIQKILLVIFLIPVIIALVIPRKIGFYLPKFLLRSFWMNLLFLLVPLLIYLTAAAMVYQWSLIFAEAKGGDSGYVVAYGVLFAYVFAAITLIPATLIFLYAYLGLFQNHEPKRKGMRIAQLVLSLPAIGMAAWLLLRILREFSAQA